ncbi:hypothetical protein MKZ38_005225 [Zalerion maritima]|uniref:Uncharacterized protein n=1 Tax=Zalerion maritima TaxID=339359 RepID=A0AAD5RKQ7_9PEZI|nr:hypothetical protein MKZ38_005225 [Zalerion maritima]
MTSSAQQPTVPEAGAKPLDTIPDSQEKAKFSPSNTDSSSELEIINNWFTDTFRHAAEEGRNKDELNTIQNLELDDPFVEARKKEDKDKKNTAENEPLEVPLQELGKNNCGSTSSNHREDLQNSPSGSPAREQPTKSNKPAKPNPISPLKQSTDAPLGNGQLPSVSTPKAIR